MTTPRPASSLASPLLALALAGCCSSPTPPKTAGAADGTVPRCRKVRLCAPPNECPVNSPEVNTFPVSGLDPDGGGACNPEAVQLMPGSLAGGGCGKRATLRFADGALVGHRSDGGECRGAALIGARFALRSADGELAISIAGVSTISVGGTTYETYRLETRDDGANAGAPSPATRSLCDAAVSAAAREALDLPAIDRVDLFGVGAPPTAEVIAIEAPLYSTKNQIVPNDTDPRWFHLACTGDALAKLVLDKLRDPDETKNEAALQLLTGKYCGGQSYTVRGLEISLAEDPHKPHFEASWTDKGAACLDTPRLVGYQQAGKTYPQDLPDLLQPPGCRGEDAASHPCDWPTWTANLRASCNLPACGGTPRPDAAYSTWTE